METRLNELSAASARGIWDKVSGSEHPHAACVAMFDGKIDDPHAFCAAVEKLAAGTTPQQRAAAKKDHAIDPDHAHSIAGVEIFSAGKHNGDEYTETDLDDMVRAFNALDYQPPLKAGHTEDKKGMPSLGWVANLRRAGTKLVADFVNMPTLVFDAVRNRRYNTVSSEVYWNLPRGGKVFRRALKAVALLGAEIPAVANLKPLHEMFAADADVRLGREVTFSIGQPSGEPTIHKESKMDEQEMKDKLAAAEAKAKEYADKAAAAEKVLADTAARVAKLEAAVTAKGATDIDKTLLALNEAEREAELKKFQVDLAAAQKTATAEREAREAVEKAYAADKDRLAKLEEEARLARVGQVAARCRVPALRVFVQQFVDLATRSADIKLYDDKGQSVSAMEAVESFVKHVNDNAARLFTVVSAHTDATAAAGSSGSADVDVDKATRKYMLDHKVSDYGAAMNAVLASDPVLKEQYLAQFRQLG